ncbi:MAG: TIGR03118 family protein [Saprospiraceae bacterium]
MNNSFFSTIKNLPQSYILSLMFLLVTWTFIPGCKDDNANPDASYQQVNLVASSNDHNATRIDTNLVNAWGTAIGPTGAFWISSTEKDLTTVYDRNGVTLLAPINVEGEPTGVVYNGTADFVIPSTSLVSKFIYVGEEGTVHSWSSGTTAVEVVDNHPSGAVYKGVALAADGGANFLYIANFSEGEIEVLDKNFAYVTTKPFEDATIPAGFAPFNVQNIDGKLFVTYAKQSADKYDDVSGAGNGYVNIFKTDGTLVKRFASQGTLNSPWGIAKAPDGFDQGSGAILIGNFGDGRINIFDKDGVYKGQLKDGSTPITIEGLWSLTFPSNGIPVGDLNQLFFTAGPDDESHGLFGYIKLR